MSVKLSAPQSSFTALYRCRRGRIEAAHPMKLHPASRTPKRPVASNLDQQAQEYSPHHASRSAQTLRPKTQNEFLDWLCSGNRNDDARNTRAQRLPSVVMQRRDRVIPGGLCDVDEIESPVHVRGDARATPVSCPFHESWTCSGFVGPDLSCRPIQYTSEPFKGTP